VNSRVVVIGAGPAGLSAAWKLSEKGVNVHVVEAQGHTGGLAHTMNRNGYLFDFGPHRFHTDNPAILAEIERLMGKMPELPRKTRVYFMDKYYDYPLSATNLLSSLPPWVGVTCFADFLATWAKNRVRPPVDDSFESWVVNRFGRRLYDIYFGPYTAKVWGRDPSKLSSNWAAQRVAVVDLWDLILRTFNLKRGYNNFQHSPYKFDFWYPPYGVGSIYERMAEQVIKNGGKISLKTPVREVNCVDGGVRSVIVEQDGQREEMEADYFVSSVPVSGLIKGLRPQVPEDVLAAANSLQFRAMVFLYLTIDKPSVSDDHWIYFPERHVIFNRISEMKNFTPLAAPEGKTSLTVEITCDFGDEIWNAPEEELYQRSVKGLVDAGLIRADQVIDHFFTRTRNAYPTYDLNFEFNLARMAYHLAEYRNMIVCGRQGLFRYINQDHAIEMGFSAAEEILTQQIGTKVTRVGTEQVYFG
jgi:protoporphyrinogen oxidase